MHKNKVKNLAFNSAIPLSVLIQNKENTLKKYMHFQVHCSIIYNSKDMEVAEVSTDE